MSPTWGESKPMDFSQRLNNAILHTDLAIEQNIRWMREQHDRIGPSAGPFQPYIWQDKHGRPILADLLAAKGQLLAALANTPRSDG